MNHIDAMNLALEALEHCKDAIVERGLNGSPEFAKKWGLTLPIERSEEAITALREALAEQPAQQEPVAWEYCEEIYAKGNPELNDHIRANGIPLYTSPPAQRKPWVGLTDEEKKEFIWMFDETKHKIFLHFKYMEAIEAKLKEKNT